MFGRTLAVVGVAFLLVTAGGAGALGPTAENANVQTHERGDADGQTADRDGRTIDVFASGEAETTPDQAVVRVAVLARADDADEVRARLARNASRMREALANLGLSDDEIRTVAYSIDQERRTDDRNRTPTGFRGVHAFEVTLSNVSRAGTVVDAAVENGADRVDGVELTLSADRRREVRAEALRNAMANARADADVVAESANLTITGVHSASTGEVHFGSVRAEAFETETADAARTEIESGPVTVTAQVQVTYNATDASGNVTGA